MKISNIKVLSVFLPHLRKRKGSVFTIIFFITFIALIDIVTPLFYKTFFDALVDGGSDREAQVGILMGIVATIAVLHGVGWAARRIVDFVNVGFQSSSMRDIERTGFSYLIDHSEKFFADTFVGSLVRKIRRLSMAFERLVDSVIWDFWPVTVSIIGYLIVISTRSFEIFLMMIIWIIFLVVGNYLFARYKQRFDIKRAKVDSEVTGTLADSISNHTTVKVFTGEDYERGLFDVVSEKWRAITRTSWLFYNYGDAVQYGLVAFVDILMLYFSARLWASGTITVGDIVLFQSYFMMLSGHIYALGRSIRRTFEALADAREMVEILGVPHDIRDTLSAKDLVVKRGRIEFKKVGFRYNKTRKVIDGLSMTIKSREKVALVGPSGAGKSTIVKILLRFANISGGKLLIDGVPLRKYTLKSLRGQISYVPQEPVLFHRSIMENIRYGRVDATDEEVMEAARKARALGFIEELPDKFDTLVGERGVKLSGGERQRVAIARAILSDSPILILDEATSSLDSESELLIQQALEKLMTDRTTIVIAHRLSTIMKMDRILVIDDGKLVDAGTHAELTEREGIYRDLWDIQAGGFIS